MLLTAVFVILLFALTGCQTVQGLGRDIEWMGQKMGEVVDYCTASYVAAYTTTFFVVMNKDKYNSLPKKHQKTINEINAEWLVKHGQAWDDSDTAGLKFFLNQGNQMIGLDAKEAAKWQKAVSSVVDGYEKTLNEKGFEGQKIISFTKNHSLNRFCIDIF